jgi:hypothetical protein
MLLGQPSRAMENPLLFVGQDFRVGIDAGVDTIAFD